jgi:hypothetical protein
VLVQGSEPERVALLERMQRTHGNHTVQRFVQAVVQRDNPGPPVLAPPDAKQAPKVDPPKDPKTDAPTAWTHLQSFGDAELKKQLGSFYKEATANNFFKDWTPYFGTPERVIAYFAAIRKVNMPGEVHMHESAASRLEMVRARLGTANMPASDIGLGIVRGKPTGSKYLLQHHVGLAIDFRTEANPKIADQRLKTLFKLHTAQDKAHWMDLGDYNTRRAKIKALGTASAAARARAEQDELAKAKVASVDKLPADAQARINAAEIDPTSKEGKAASEFYAKIKSEHERVAGASKKFTSDLPPAVQAYLDLKKQGRDVDAQLKDVAGKLKVVAADRKKLKKGASTEDVDKRQAELDKQNADLSKQRADIMKAVTDRENDLPTLFKDWLDKIAKEKEKLQKAAGTIDLATLPSKADLDKQQLLLAKQQRDAQTEKKQMEADVARLQTRIKQAQKTIDSNAAELDKLKQQLSALPADAPAAKATTLQSKIDKLTKAKEDGEKQVTTLNDQISAIQTTPPQPGQTAAKAKPTLDRTNKKLAELDKLLKELKARTDLLPKREELDRLEALKKGLSSDKDFVFKGQRTVQDPSVMQLVQKGYMNADPDYAAGEKADSYKHGFNQVFFKTMAEFGFELGGAWESPDAMHFELVEGLDLISP